MRVLVTGANGLVGSRLVQVLAGTAGLEVAALCRGPLKASRPGVRHLEAELGDGQAVARAVAEARPEVIVNCAAMTDVDGCERAPEQAYQANAAGVASLARAGRALGAHLVQVSTDYVFDGDAGPYAPDATPNPRGVYALTKHIGEQTVRALCEPGRWAIARTAVVYGWPAAGQKNFGSWLYDSLVKGQAVKLFADQWVSPSLAAQVAEMLAELARRRLPGVWHTCGAEVVNRVDFGRRFCALFGFDPALVQPSRMAEVKLLSPRPARAGLEVGATAAALAAKPLGLDESLRRFKAEVGGTP
jgi:dTDP-4-dehydrorhamnose reductase